MLARISSLFQTHQMPTTDHKANVDLQSATTENRFPIHSVAEIKKLLDLSLVINTIKSDVGVSVHHWESLYQAPIDEFIMRAQLCPASDSNHHAQPGGLVQHTLDIAMRALRKRRGMILPQNADPEVVSRDADLWTYAIFCSAILHDIGKAIVNFRFKTDVGTFSAVGQRLCETSAKTYRIIYRKTDVHLHEKAGLTMFGILIPPMGREFLAQQPDVLAQVLQTTYNYREKPNSVIAKIISTADHSSVAEDFGAKTPQSISGATEPLSSRIMKLVQILVAREDLPLNRPGATGFIYQGDLYVLCGILADKIRSVGQEIGVSVPARNERIFDALQQAGIAKDRDGKAVWNVHVNLVQHDWSQSFKVLRIPAEKMFGPTHQYSSIEGTIDTDATNNADEPKSQQVRQPTIATDVAPTQLESDQLRSPGPSNRDLATLFMKWLCEGIEDKSIKVNQYGAFVHFVEEGMLVVSPVGFKEYEQASGHPWNKVQNGIAFSGWTLKSAPKKNKHTYVIVKDGQIKSPLQVFLFPNPEQHLKSVPDINPVLVKKALL